MLFYSIVILFIACAHPLLAADLTLTQDAAAAYALQHNPALASARLGVEEARGRLRQSGRLSNPEVELEFNRNARSRESDARLALVQRFPITGRLRYEKAVSRAQLAAAEFEVRDGERKLEAEVRGLAVKLIALHEQRDLRSNQIANVRELSEFLRKSAEAGEGPLTDALQVELESRQLEIENLQLAAEEAALLGELRVLLGAPPGGSLAVKGRLTPPVLPAHSDGGSQRPDLLAAQLRVDAARFTVKEQQARRVEDIGAGLSFTQERTIDDPNPLQTERIVGFRVSVPLPLWNRNAGRIHEANAALARADREMTAMQWSAVGETMAAREAMKVYAKILTTLDGTALPQAKQIEEQLSSGHSSGHTPLSEVLRTRARRLELQRQRLDALRDFHLAHIRYVSATNQSTPSK